MPSNRLKDKTAASLPAYDDKIYIDGPTNNVRALDGRFPANIRNALAPRGGIAFDGTSGANATVTLTGQSFGTDPFSISVVFNVPTSAPANVQGIAFIGPVANQAANNNTARLYLGGGGVLVFDNVDGSGNTRQVSLSGFVTNYAGKRVHVVAVRQASGDHLIYVNGVAITGTASGSASPQASVTSTYFVLGAYSSTLTFAGTIYSATPYNLALAASDVLEIFEMNGAVPYRFHWGTQVLGYASDFSAGVNGWVTGDGGTLTGNVDGINGQNDWLEHSSNTSAEVYAYGPALPSAYFGKAARFSGRIFVPSGTLIAYLSWFNDNGSVASLITGLPLIPITGNTQYDFDGVAVIPANASTNSGIRSENADGSQSAPGTGQVLYIKNISWRPVGAVAHLTCDDGLGFQAIDQSSNKLHATISATGVTHIIGKSSGRIRFTTSTNGNQQILGQQALPANARIRSWAIDSAATPTVKLGNASAGAQFFTATALSAGLNDITPITRFCSTNNLWVNSTTTDVLQHTIDYEFVD